MKKLLLSISALSLAVAIPLMTLAANEPIGLPTGGGIGVSGGATPPSVTLPPAVTPQQVQTLTPAKTNPINDFIQTDTQNASGKPTDSAAAAAAAAAGEIQCPETTSGNTISQALSNVGGQFGQAALQGVANGIGGQGIVGRAAGSILTGQGVGSAVSGFGSSILQGVGGVAGNTISQSLGGACGNSSIGSRICGSVANAAGQYVQGAINQYGGQILQTGLKQLGISQLGGLFGASGVGGVLKGLGGSLGGIAGVLGGGAVPITNTKLEGNSDAQTQLQQANLQKTSTLVENECNFKPSVAQLANLAKANITKTVLTTAAQQLQQNPSEEEKRAAISNAQEYINGLTDDQEKAAATQLITDQINGKPTPDCNVSSSAWNRFKAQVFYPDFCTSSGRYAKLYTDIQSSETEGIAAYKNGVAADEKPLGICKEGFINAGSHDIADCPKSFQITESGKAISAISEKAQGQFLDQQPDSIGQTANQFVADLLNQVFTVTADAAASGLSRLVNDRLSGYGSGSNHSGSSGSGSSAYLDLLTGSGPTATQSHGYIESSINDSLALEAQARAITTAVIQSLNPLADTFSQIQMCYVAFSSNPPSGLSANDVAFAADNASTTINSIIAPQIQTRQTDLARFETATNNLTDLLTQLQSAQTTDQLNAVSTAYNAMGEQGMLVTQADVQALSDDATQLTYSLGLAQQDAQAQLTQCQGYSGTSSGG